MTDRTRLIMRYVFLVAVAVVGVFSIVATQSGGTGGTGGTPTVGSISVNMGFGAVSSPPYQCTGTGNVTISPQTLTGTTGNGQTQTKPFSYSGYSSTTPNEPACQTTVIFTGLTTGTWQATDGIATCQVTVTAGQLATVKIWNEVCQ